MHLSSFRDAAHRGARRLLLVGLFAVVALLAAAAVPTVSFAATPAMLPAAAWADPDTGYWIELFVVAIITAIAGIVFNVRRKPDP